MGKDILTIREYKGDGYKALIDFKSWRVAILRWAPLMAVEKLNSMERHTQTDEVFVMLNGYASIVLGGNSNDVDQVRVQEMEVGKLYNVRQNAWHAVMMSQDASILIVEENDTGKDNTEYCQLNDGFRQEIRVIAERISSK